MKAKTKEEGRNMKKDSQTHLKVVNTLDTRPVPPRESTETLNDNVVYLLLLARLLALLVQDVEAKVPFRLLLVPLGRSKAVTVAEEAVELVLGGDLLEVGENLGARGVEVRPVVL
jgi:hypothetical protein